MQKITRNLTALTSILILLTAVTGFAQTQPLLQDIKVVQPKPTPSQAPLIKKTGDSSPVTTTSIAPVPSANAVRTMFPALAALSIPGTSGVLVETLEGNVVLEANPDGLFNPASNVKIATSYAILKSFGPEFRFATNIYTDGAVDHSSQTLNGNLYVSGKDPVFGFEHAVSIANELNRIGIRTINGNVIVTGNFSMNYNSASARAAQTLVSTLDASKRSAAATRVWQTYLSNSGQFGKVNGIPSVTVTGSSSVQGIPSNLNFLFAHESAQMKDIVKAMMCYSNNFLAERLGEMIGGPYSVSRMVQINANIAPNEFSIQTSSGLGYNRVSPNAMMKLLRALRGDLAKMRMSLTDIMPVAGIDKGTLANRFDLDGFNTGSVVGKTGTLGVTDGGASALAGEINTKNGKLLFVIFNNKGGVQRFRAFQNNFVSVVQSQFGGPVSLGYSPVSLDARLATSRITRNQYAGN